MQDRKWILRIIYALLLLAVIMGITLFSEGVNPFSRQAADIVLDSTDSVLSDSSKNIWDASVITSEESEQAVSPGMSASASASGKSADKKAVKSAEKEEKQEQKAMNRTGETIQSSVDGVIYRIAGWLPAWLPGRAYIVTFSILGLMVLVLWLINKYM